MPSPASRSRSASASSCSTAWRRPAHASSDGPGGRAFAFPSPDDLAGREPDELRALGFSRQKARAIIELARALAEAPPRPRRARGPRRRGGRGAVARLARRRPLDRGVRAAAGPGTPARVPGRRRRRPQQSATLARAFGTARLRRGATGAREVAAVPGPGLPAPSAEGPAARGRAPARPTPRMRRLGHRVLR